MATSNTANSIEQNVIQTNNKNYHLHKYTRIKIGRKETKKGGSWGRWVGQNFLYKRVFAFVVLETAGWLIINPIQV